MPTRVSCCSIWGSLDRRSSAPIPSPKCSARNQNILAAVDLATGEIQWEIGGARGDHKNREHAGTFFLGSGLPLESALYCLGEQDGEISLFKLEPATGKTIWSQRLVTPLGRLPHFPLRRLAGDNPSYASGILICPTSAGVVAAVDPASRTLLWEYRYAINVAANISDPARHGRMSHSLSAPTIRPAGSIRPPSSPMRACF